MKTLLTLLTIGNTYVDARGKRPDFLHDSFCNLPLMRLTYDVELSISTLKNRERKSRVEREFCLATLKNREQKENFVLPLLKIESRKRIVSYHSRKSRVEREMETIKFSRSREKFLFLLSIFLSRARLLSMPALKEVDREAAKMSGKVTMSVYITGIWKSACLKSLSL